MEYDDIIFKDNFLEFWKFINRDKNWEFIVKNVKYKIIWRNIIIIKSINE